MMRFFRLWIAVGFAAMAFPLGARGSAPATALPGYARAVAGNTIVYQSYSPLATMALLTRTTDGRDAIVWDTAPIPADFREPFATFTWIAGYGLATSSGTRHFTMSIDGRSVLTFSAGGTATARDWSVTGADGVRLRFHARWDDVNGDRMGDMYLTVPASMYRAEQPLRIRVVGEAAGTQDWYMTFEYAQGEHVAAVAQPALVRCGNRICQVIDLHVNHVGVPAMLRAMTGSSTLATATVAPGYQRVEVRVPEVAHATNVPLKVSVGTAFHEHFVLHIAPVPARTFYIIHHSHMDVGYNLTQPAAVQQQMNNIRDAIALARKTAHYPPAARFKWNIESLWGVQAFLAGASPAERAAFLHAVRDGSIGIYANYANELTGIESGEELMHLADYARYLERTYGLRIDAAFISDVPNYSWPIVPALASAGVHYFSVGPNYVFDSPYRGARAGYTYAHGDAPFWWVSPSGTQRVLFWMAGHGYSSFHNYNMRNVFAPPTDFDAKLRNNILQYAMQLQDERYPYEMVQLRYTYPADNSPVDPHLSDFVRAWNERFVSPKLVIATVDQLFGAFARRYGKTIPTLAGDLTPYWEDGAQSTAREEAIARRSQARVAQASILTSMLAPSRYDARRFDDVWNNLLMWDEHTWGAWNSTSEPDSAFVLAQWRFKQQFALQARRESRALMHAALGDRDATWATRFTVYNTASWARSGVVVLPPLATTGGDTVVDARGVAVPSQRLNDGRLAFLATHVPPLGSARYTVTDSPWRSRGDARASGEALSTRDLALVIDPKSGAIASVRLRGREFVDSTTYPGIDTYVYVPGVDPALALGVRGPVHVSVVEPGPVVAVLRISNAAPGTSGLVRFVRVTSGSDSIEIFDTIDKTRVQGKESVHFAFPFAISKPTTRVDLGFGVLIPGVNQLPGSNHDFYPVRQFVDVSDSTSGVTLATPDVPLLELGSLADERPGPGGERTWKKTGGSSALVYSYAMNNYWGTNYKADQPGLVTLRYALLPYSGAYDAERSARFGDAVAQPLIVAPSRPNDTPAPPFTLSGDAIVTSIRPVYGSHDRHASFAVRFYNPDPHPIVVTLHDSDGHTERLKLQRYGVLLHTLPAVR